MADPCPAVSLLYEGGTVDQILFGLPTLDSLGLKTTFALSPTQILRDPRLFRRLHSDGHEIGLAPFLGVTDGHGNLPNWTLGMVTEELVESEGLWQSEFGESGRSFLAPGVEMMCAASQKDHGLVSYEPILRERYPLICGVESGRNKAGGDLQYLHSFPLHSVEEALLHVALATKSADWIVFRIGAWTPAVADAHEELCRWLAKEQPQIMVGPVASVAAEWQDAAQTVG